MFSQVAIEGQFTNPDGSPASGTVCLTPNSRLVNGEDIQSEAPICGVLEAQGRIVSQGYQALVVSATDDEGTTPVGASYTVTLQVNGQEVVEFATPVSEDFGPCHDVLATTSETEPTIVLVGLIASPSMVGATLTGNNFDGAQEIISVDPGANMVTVNTDASATGVDGAIVITGGCASFALLEANAL